MFLHKWKISWQAENQERYCSCWLAGGIFCSFSSTISVLTGIMCMKATFWSDALYLTRTGHYGGKAVFKGRECRKLIENRDILKTLL